MGDRELRIAIGDRSSVLALSSLRQAMTVTVTPEPGNTTDERWRKEARHLVDDIGSFLTLGPQRASHHLVTAARVHRAAASSERPEPAAPQRAFGSRGVPLTPCSRASAMSFRTLSASGPSGTTFKNASAALTAAGKSCLP
jgi:hypothetical protein